MFPAYIFIRLISPIKLIRFGSLMDERIGHFAGNNEIYMCEREHGMQPSNTLDYFYNSQNVCNHQLLKMWKRVLTVNQIAYFFYILNRYFPGGEKHKITITCSDRDIYGLLEKSKIHLSFAEDEVKDAEYELNKMGIYSNDKYICVLGRDKEYLNTIDLNNDWHYHDYRNSNIQSFVLASEELTKNKYHVIRMGSVVSEAMETTNPMIIELAIAGHRTELLDVYLSANCYFCLTNGTGIDGISRIFRRPIVMVNHVPLEYLIGWGTNMISIEKKYWLKDEHRFMSFKEILKSGVGRYLQTQKFDAHGIELIENTAEEIRDVAIEMDERLKGTWVTSDEDEELQRRFWTIFKSFSSGDLNKVYRARIGANYLRQNRELLD